MKTIIQQLKAGTIRATKSNYSYESKNLPNHENSPIHYTGRIINLMLPYLDCDISDKEFNKLHDEIQSIVVELKRR